MNKKILIGSIFAALLMLSMPVISNIHAQPVAPATTTGDPPTAPIACGICELGLKIGKQAWDMYKSLPLGLFSIPLLLVGIAIFNIGHVILVSKGMHAEDNCDIPDYLWDWLDEDLW